MFGQGPTMPTGIDTGHEIDAKGVLTNEILGREECKKRINLIP